MKGASMIAPFGLRMPEELKEKVAARAKENGRSMNAEIVHILEDALDIKSSKITSHVPLEYLIDPACFEQKHGIAEHLRMLAQVIENQSSTSEQPAKTPLATLKQNRTGHKSRKDK